MTSGGCAPHADFVWVYPIFFRVVLDEPNGSVSVVYNLVNCVLRLAPVHDLEDNVPRGPEMAPTRSDGKS